MFVALALLTTEARAQQPANVHRIGYLIYGSPVSVANRTEALRMGLRDLGYVEGENITIAFRSAATADRLPEAAADLVRLNVDVLLATSSTEVEATRTTSRYNGPGARVARSPAAERERSAAAVSVSRSLH